MGWRSAKKGDQKVVDQEYEGFETAKSSDKEL